MSELVLDRQGGAGDTDHRLRLDRKKLTLSGLALLAAVGTTWYGYHWWNVARWQESTDDAYVGGDMTPIAPHVAGFVTQILVKDNQLVHKGELLVRLDDRDAQAALARDDAIVTQREATLESLKSSRALQGSTVLQAKAEVASKMAAAQFAALDAERYRRLARTEYGSRQNAQRSESARAQAEAAVSAARAGLDAARQRLSVLDGQIAEAGAAIAEAKATLETARLNLGYTEVRSPIDGYVGNRAAQVGAYVSTGTYLLTIVPSHGLWVDANFKEDQLGRIRGGDPATIVADVLPGQVLHGHVASLAPATGATFSVIPPENATGNFTKIVQRVPVRIVLDDDHPPPGRLRPGLSTTVTVDSKAD